MTTQRTFMMKITISKIRSANEELIEITEKDLSDSEIDTLLRLREALEDNDFGKTEVNLKYGDEKLRKNLSK